jgi:hypothetical protein
MKLTTMIQVTVDGVIQGRGAALDDRRNTHAVLTPQEMIFR